MFIKTTNLCNQIKLQQCATVRRVRHSHTYDKLSTCVNVPSLCGKRTYYKLEARHLSENRIIIWREMISILNYIDMQNICPFLYASLSNTLFRYSHDLQNHKLKFIKIASLVQTKRQTGQKRCGLILTYLDLKVAAHFSRHYNI